MVWIMFSVTKFYMVIGELIKNVVIGALGYDVNPLSVSPQNGQNTLKQFVRFCQQIVWVCF